MMKKGWLIILIGVLLAGCREYTISDDPALRLSFSRDTISFDTVFTEQGSATFRLMVYNPNKSALLIRSIGLDENKYFSLNIDGEQKTENLTDLQINGGDSLFVFVRVHINPTGENNPVLVSNNLHFYLSSGVKQSVHLEAYGQDVTRIKNDNRGVHRVTCDTCTFTAEKPYLIFDTLIVSSQLTIEPGATIYMHNGACIIALGDVTAVGNLTQPILIRGDRLDNLFDSVPYLYAGGSWDGIYLIADHASTYTLDYVDILSGTVGLYCYGPSSGTLPTLHMNGCRIHNHTLYGVVLTNTNAVVTNTEISNCASYCVYCSGGEHEFIHSTIASYFGNTNIRIQPTLKEDVAAVYINNLQKQEPHTISSFRNCIITGYLANQLVVATPFDRYYPGTFIGNYLKTDTLDIPHAEKNTYWQPTDTTDVFHNDYYKYKEYHYYDFRLDSLSPAIGIGDSLTAVPYSTDRMGTSRALCLPDAGAYQH